MTKPLCGLLKKDVKIVFTTECFEALNSLEKMLSTVPIITSLDWTIPFELMCDATDFAVGAVLDQRKDKVFHNFYYASNTLKKPKSITPLLKWSL